MDASSGGGGFDPYALDDIFGEGGDLGGPPSGELRSPDHGASGPIVLPENEEAPGSGGEIRVRVRTAGTLDEAPRSIRIALEGDDVSASGRRAGAGSPAGTLPPIEPPPKREKRPEPKAFIPGSVYGDLSEDAEDDGFDFDSTEIDSSFETDLDRRFGDAARRMRERISQREAVVQEDPRRGAKVALGLGCLLLATVGFLLGYRYWLTRQDGPVGPSPAPIHGSPTAGSSQTPAGAPEAGPDLPPLPPADTVEGKIKRAVSFGLPIYRAAKEER